MSASTQNDSPSLVVIAQQRSRALDVASIGPDMIDENALAVRLGVSRSTLQSWRYAGRGPRYIKLGRLVRYRNADVEAYLNERTRGRVA